MSIAVSWLTVAKELTVLMKTLTLAGTRALVHSSTHTVIVPAVHPTHPTHQP